MDMNNISQIKAVEESTPLRLIAVASGKGGVGKTVVSSNLACSLGEMGKKVLILDADLGLANVDIVLGLAPQWHIGHVLAGTKSLDEALIQVESSPNVWVLPAASGISELAEMSDNEKLAFLSIMDGIEQRFDFMIIDNAAGIGSNVVYFTSAGQDVLIVLTPEPTAITDAYAAIKVLSSQAAIHNFDLIVNMAPSREDGEDVFGRISAVTARFLDVNLRLLGIVQRDESVSRAIIAQRALVEMLPQSPGSRCIRGIAEKLVAREPSLDSGRATFAFAQTLGDRP